MTAPLALTAMGVASPLGRGKAETARRLFAGTRAGLIPLEGLVPGRTVIVGAVGGDLPAPPPTLARYDCRNNRLMSAVIEEIAEAVDAAAERHGRDRVAVVLGTSTGGMASAEAAYAARQGAGTWPATFDYRQLETGGLAEFAARRMGLTGPAYTVATACSSSAKVLASARRLIGAGLADAAVAGGADTLCRLTLSGFHALEALSPGVCNPFSANRDGINVGEGAVAFLVEARPGPVHVLGVGETSDAHHVSAPDPQGRGAREAMRLALVDAGLAPDDIAYLNLHGTGTGLNDAMESRAVASLFGATHVPCSSTKAMTGHMLGAAGGCEAAFLWLALHPEYNPGLLPPHLWDGVADPSLPPLNLVAAGTPVRDRARLAMLSNAFAFGGSNVALVLGRGTAP